MTCLVNEHMAICRPDVRREVVGHFRSKWWCFKCRSRFIHDKVAYFEVLKYDEAGELINGYYEPYSQYECRNCHEEHYEFGS